MGSQPGCGLQDGSNKRHGGKLQAPWGECGEEDFWRSSPREAEIGAMRRNRPHRREKKTRDRRGGGGGETGLHLTQRAEEAQLDEGARGGARGS